MRQFDVVASPETGDPDRPYLLVLQSDLIAELRSTIVAPLIVHARMRGAQRLSPVVTIDGEDYWLAVHELFAVDRRILPQPVANLSDQRDAIIAALDLLFTGI